MKPLVKIKTADQLMACARNKHSVSGFHAHTDSPMPAAFLVSMQFRIVMDLISSGRLSVYEKTNFQRPKWAQKTTQKTQ